MPTFFAPRRFAFWFQSAPPSEERGDGQLMTRSAVDDPFQSAPPSEERGDKALLAELLEDVVFQSAPPSEERGDPCNLTRCCT